MTVCVRSLSLEPPAEASSQPHLQCQVIGTVGVRQKGVIRVVWVGGLAIDDIAADQFSADRGGMPDLQHEIRSDRLLYTEIPVLSVRCPQILVDLHYLRRRY